MPNKGYSLSLLYRSSIHNFTFHDFHSRVDNKGPTLTLMKSQNGNVFGGFASISWYIPAPTAGNYCMPDALAYIFHVTKATNFV